MKKYYMAAAFCLLATSVTAQDAEPKPDRWSFGFSGGVHSSFMRFSDLDEEVFPAKKSLTGGTFSFFLQREFGKEHQFAVRPELSYLRRGGTLKEIYSKNENFYEEYGLDDVSYRLSSGYLDIRVPLIWQFGKAQSTLRPYVYVAPVIGFSLGGGIDVEAQYLNEETDKTYAYDGVHMDLTKANMKSLYVAAAVGAGVKWQFNVGRHTCFLGLEAMYEHGLTDTYGDDNKAKGKYSFSDLFEDAPVALGNKVDGTRKFSGVEVKMTLGIPFSVFKKKEAAPLPVVVETPRPEPVPVPEVREEPVEKPCYSLEEINDLMARGERVEGKTICAIDDAINFDFGKSNIKPVSFDYLDKLAQTLIRTNAHIKVKGHTDNVGSEEFNMKLSKERAKAVVEYLVKKGVSRAKLSYGYYGMSRPLTSNDTEEGRTMNRRVEFEILR